MNLERDSFQNGTKLGKALPVRQGQRWHTLGAWNHSQNRWECHIESFLRMEHLGRSETCPGIYRDGF